MVNSPGNHVIEVLEYVTPPVSERAEMKPMQWLVGNWHLCLALETLDEMLQVLEAEKEGGVCAE